MRANKRIESIIAAVVLIEDLPSGDPSSIIHDLRKVAKVVEKLNKRESALVEALEKYGKHSMKCDIHTDLGGNDAECICGLKALLATHPQEEAKNE